MTLVTDRDLAAATEPTLQIGGSSRGRRVLRVRDLWERLSLPLVRSLVVALVLGLAGAGGAVGLLSSRPATYQSQATLLLDEPVAIAASGDAGVVLKLTALRPKYAALALPAPVLRDAARRAGLPVGTVATDARVILAANSLTLQSQGVSPDPAVARNVAQSLGEALSAYVASEQLSLRVPAPERLAVNVIDPAGPAQKTSPTVRRIATEAAVTGVVVAILVYLLAQLVWTRARRL